MSNENSSINRPRRNVVTRSRKFSCVTYLNEIQLKLCLMKHINQIRCYAYAFHDKDTKEDGTLKEPHFHIVIVTYNACTISAVRRWFSGYVDSNGDITTTAQHCGDVYEMFDYLTHNTVKCRAENKYQYDKSIVQTNDLEYFQASPQSEYDNILLASEMLLNGATVRDVGKIFGRDFILHYNAIRQYIDDVLQFDRIEINHIADILSVANKLNNK